MSTMMIHEANDVGRLSPMSYPRTGSRRAGLFLALVTASLLAISFSTDGQVQRVQSVLIKQNRASAAASKMSLSMDMEETSPITTSNSTTNKNLRTSSKTTTSDITKNIKSKIKSNNNDQHPWPRIAWLMSFPNSGTSYTGQLVKHLTKTKTASNYGEQNVDLESGNSVPVYPDNWDGPFYVDPSTTKGYHTPTRYVLTKTHCGGYTTNTSPDKYVEATHSFRRRCLATKYARSSTKNKKNNKYTTTQMRGEYDGASVYKAIHLVRNPFDNIVSRFNFEYKRERKNGRGLTTTTTTSDGTTMATNITKSREGFRAFCRDMDTTWKESERNSIVYEESILAKMESVPCHSDFMRYIEWHNLAFVTTQDLGIETMILHYEDYGSKFTETKDAILNFLELEERGYVPPFDAGKKYSKEYFTKKEREAVKEVLQLLALRTTWNNLERYFA